MRALVFVAVLLGATVWAVEPCSVTGSVEDTSGRALTAVTVLIQNEASGARWTGTSDEQGRYAFAGLPAGTYKLTVRLPGFRTISKGDVSVGPGESRRVDFVMELLARHETVTVLSARDDIDPSSGESLLMKRNSPGATLPANGPDYRTLFNLMPGVVVTPAGLGDGGQFTANGQRPNAHFFRIDGVSANTGVGGSTLPGSFPGASLPAMSASGSTENLSTSETIQSVELRTSNFAPELGGRTGADTLIVTRSGTNEFHGAVTAHLRDNSWTARDWFANSLALAYTRPNYRDVGGVLGGPLWRDRTFFFVAVERSTLNDSGLELISVPSLAARESAPDALRRTLNAFPLPLGRDLGAGMAEGATGIGRTASVTNYSVRLDHTLGTRGTVFVRYTQVPSSSYSPHTSASEGVSNWRSLTAGATLGLPVSVVHDLRFNYSRADFRSTFTDSPWWPAFAVTGLLPAANSGGIWKEIVSHLPGSASSANVWGVYIPGLGQFLSGDYGRSRQDQWEFNDTLTQHRGHHQLRAGIDYVQLAPSRNTPLTTVLGSTSGLQSLLAGDALSVTVTQIPQLGERVHALSLFAQDKFQLTDALSIIYGLRWEMTPPNQSQTPYNSVSGRWDGTTWAQTQLGAVNASAPWPMRYGQLAPRIGLAYRLPFAGLTLRAGAGVFYDATLGATVNSINGAPFNSWLLSGGSMGSAAYASTSTPVATQTAPSPDVQRFLDGPYEALRLPTSYQWRTALEKALGTDAVASAVYVGSLGRNLLGNEVHVDPATGLVDRSVTLTESRSSYHSLQLRYGGTLAKKVYATVSYAWAHCLDNGSADSSVFLVHAGYTLDEARGRCNFDVRHALTSSASYRVPFFGRAEGWRAWLGGWTISGIARLRGGFPMNVTIADQALGQRFSNAARPNLVAAQPIWIEDDNVARHRRLNASAFQVPANGAQGTLPRNAISGNGLTQFDASLRRSFLLFSSIALEIGASVFNVANHPGFADPVSSLASPWFGVPTSMQNLMLGSGTPNTGLTPLFHTGGARSAELNLRVSF